MRIYTYKPIELSQIKQFKELYDLRVSLLPVIHNFIERTQDKVINKRYTTSLMDALNQFKTTTIEAFYIDKDVCWCAQGRRGTLDIEARIAIKEGNTTNMYTTSNLRVFRLQLNAGDRGVDLESSDRLLRIPQSKAFKELKGESKLAELVIKKYTEVERDCLEYENKLKQFIEDNKPANKWGSTFLEVVSTW